MAKSNWNEMYELAKKYYNCNNNLKIPKSFTTNNGYTYDENGKKLGIWICNQRASYKNKRLDNTKIEKLNEIEMIWKVEKHTWNEMYDLAKKYYFNHKDLKIPKSFKTKNGYTYDENGVSLGIWINDQRRNYKKKIISQDKVKMLNDIGMIWNTSKYIWEEMYNLAAIYYTHHHHLKIPKSFKTKNGYTYDENGKKLGIWICNQRQIYNSKENKQKPLTQSQIYLLNNIGMIWNASTDYEKKWYEMYKLAYKYYSYYKSLDIPIKYKTKDGINYSDNGVELGTWIHNQRAAYKLREKGKPNHGLYPLSDDKVLLLEKIGMIWNVYSNNWFKNYEIAKTYYLTYGNLEVPSNFMTINGIDYNERGINLYNWLKYQRRAYKAEENDKNTSKLTNYQIEKLENIGMIWEKEKDLTSNWLKMYKLAYIYYENNGNLDIKVNFKTKNGIDYDEEGKSLGRWIRRQRENYKKRTENKITDEQINLLNEIGMIWQKQERKPRFSKINAKSENLKEQQLYIELVAKIRYLNLNKLPLIVDGKPNQIFYMSESSLIKEYNMNNKELIDKYYSEVQSAVVIKKIKKIIK